MLSKQVKTRIHRNKLRRQGKLWIPKVRQVLPSMPIGAGLGISPELLASPDTGFSTAEVMNRHYGFKKNAT